MRHGIRRLAALAAAAVLALCGIPALAEENAPQEYVKGVFTYILLEDGTAEIIGYSGKSDSTGVPVELDGHIVSSVRGNPFASNKEVKRFDADPDHPYFAVIDGVLFRKADKRLVAYPPKAAATEYTVPGGIRIIGDEAFANCKTLRIITLPDTLTTIGDSAFKACRELVSMTIPQSVTDIGMGTFWDCSKMISVTLPEGIAQIGDKMFRNCERLREIAIPESVTLIGDEAFGKCDALQSVTIPAGVQKLGANPFVVCDHLTEIVVADGNPVLEAAEGVLYWKNGAEKHLVTYLNALPAAEYTVAEDVTVIGDNAFWNCKTLQSVAFPQSLTAIGEYAFARCENLTSITMPDTLTDIGRYAFSDCSKLQSAVVPEGVTILREGVFDSCFQMTSLTLPASLTAIEHRSFAYNTTAAPVVTVPRGSYAETFAREHYLSLNYPDSNDWLND